MPKVIKTEQSIYECLLGFYALNNISAPPQILAASKSRRNSRNVRNDG